MAYLGAIPVLIGLNRDELVRVADQIANHGNRRAVVLAADLLDDAQRDSVTKEATTVAGAPVAFVSTIGFARMERRPS